MSSRRLERHMFLFTISMYIYVNGERGTRVRGGVGCRRRDANESRLYRRKFFSFPWETYWMETVAIFLFLSL